MKFIRMHLEIDNFENFVLVHWRYTKGQGINGIDSTMSIIMSIMESILSIRALCCWLDYRCAFQLSIYLLSDYLSIHQYKSIYLSIRLAIYLSIYWIMSNVCLYNCSQAVHAVIQTDRGRPGTGFFIHYQALYTNNL